MIGGDKKRWVCSQLEPRTATLRCGLWLKALLSIAISLNRLADNYTRKEL